MVNRELLAIPRPVAGEEAPRATTVARAYRRIGCLMLATDGLAMVAAMLLAYRLRFGSRTPSVEFLLMSGSAVPVWLGIFAAYSLYAVRRHASTDEFRRILSAVSVGVMVVVAISFWSKEPFSRGYLAMAWAFAVLLVLGTRLGWHRFIRRANAAGELTLRTLIVGTNEEAERLAGQMSPVGNGLEPIGHVETMTSQPGLDGVPVVGDLADLAEVVRATRADCVFVASSAVRLEDMRGVTKLARQRGVEVRVSASLPELSTGRLSAQPFAGQMTLSLAPVRLSRPKAALKRAFDLGLSIFGILLTAPVWLVTAIAVKVSSHGPVFFRQIRVGRGGTPFTVYKFRTMHNGAEEALAELRALNEASGPLFKMRDDPRVTRVGKFLRRWSLDELPQLWNVVRGDMSLVGPRPPLPEEVEAYEQDWHFDRLEVMPGITGLWQVSGRSNLSFDDYMRLDLSYVENWSVGFDMFILAKTLPALLSRKGAW
ncbi:MAG TPA: sugar transferase [Actinomycetota bacterium]|jgi:exopolysaccharide biosynthesis polyprenyl glycosylphosphotransferase